jgi:RecT family
MITQATVEEARGTATQIEMPTPQGGPMTIRQHLEEVRLFGGAPVTPGAWRVLTRMLFPNAPSDAIIMALHYCHVRQLDIMKRAVNIVPMRVKNGDEWEDVFTIWPSIVEMRITAFRTKEYQGKDAMNWGPMFSPTFTDPEKVTRRQTYPAESVTVENIYEWGEMTVYRGKDAKNRVPFVGPRVYWLESFATKAGWSNIPNSMWITRKIGQHEKCIEAATLRCVFPEETGGDYAAEEMEGRELFQDRLDQQHDIRRAAGFNNLPQAHSAPQSPAGRRSPPRPETAGENSPTQPTGTDGGGEAEFKKTVHDEGAPDGNRSLGPGEVLIDKETGEVLDERPLQDTRPPRPPRPDAPTAAPASDTDKADPSTAATSVEHGGKHPLDTPWFLRVTALEKERPDFKTARLTDILAWSWQMMSAAGTLDEFEEITEKHLYPLVDDIPHPEVRDTVQGSINKFARRFEK